AGNRTRVRKLRGSLHLRACLAFCIVPARDDQRPLPGTSHLFGFASGPVTRLSASQLGYALPRAPAGPSVGRLSDLLFRQRERLRCRSQLFSRRGFTWLVGTTARSKKSLSPSKPIAPEIGSGHQAT